MNAHADTLWNRFVEAFTQSDLDERHRARLASFDKLVEDTHPPRRPPSYEAKVATAKAEALAILEGEP